MKSCQQARSCSSYRKNSEIEVRADEIASTGPKIGSCIHCELSNTVSDESRRRTPPYLDMFGDS